MKVRSGFVTNSSSSSFLIACKKELTPEAIMEAFNVPNDSLLYGVALDFTKTLYDNSSLATEESEFPDYLLDKEELEKLTKQGFEFYYGYISNDSGEVAEQYLCDVGIDYRSDSLIIIKEEGF
jgi:hypothetical protein